MRPKHCAASAAGNYCRRFSRLRRRKDVAGTARYPVSAAIQADSQYRKPQGWLSFERLQKKRQRKKQSAFLLGRARNARRKKRGDRKDRRGRKGCRDCKWRAVTPPKLDRKTLGVFDTREEAEAKLQEALVNHRRGIDLLPTSLTVSDLVERFFKDGTAELSVTTLAPLS